MTDLEAMLTRLSSLKKTALDRWAEQQRQEDDEFEVDEDYIPWLALESGGNDLWLCSYCVRPDEATERIIQESGRSPFEAAQKLLRRMEQ